MRSDFKKIPVVIQWIPMSEVALLFSHIETLEELEKDIEELVKRNMLLVRGTGAHREFALNIDTSAWVGLKLTRN
jgi:hypothetical protein